MRFQAALNGIDVDKAKQNKSDLPREGSGKFEGCIWGKPETYSHLSQEELTEWTDELIAGTKKAMGKREVEKRCLTNPNR